MVTAVFVLSAAIGAGAVAWIVLLYRRDRRIMSQGRIIRAVVEEVRTVAVYDHGARTLRYRVSWSEDGGTRYAEGRETVSAARAATVRRGGRIDIAYLDDAHLLLVFDNPCNAPGHGV